MDQTRRVGIVGVSGSGGAELLRYLARHPFFEPVYVCGDTSAGKTVGEVYPGFPRPLRELTIEKWDTVVVKDLDLLFISAPTGKSREITAQVPQGVRIVDLGGDHRFDKDWFYSIPELHNNDMTTMSRVANPGCYPTAIMLAMAPLLCYGFPVPESVFITAMSGITGLGRGGKNPSTFLRHNENSYAYGFFDHPHVPEISAGLKRLACAEDIPVTFIPHYIPIDRGIAVECVIKGAIPNSLDKAGILYSHSPFVEVTSEAPQTKWATGTNMAYVSYRVSMERNVTIALAVIDNLGKGAAGQAIQNANRMFGLPDPTGLQVMPIL